MRNLRNKRQAFAKNGPDGQRHTVQPRFVAQSADHDVNAVQFRLNFIGEKMRVQIDLATDFAGLRIKRAISRCSCCVSGSACRTAPPGFPAADPG
jgi:hypothetical protein